MANPHSVCCSWFTLVHKNHIMVSIHSIDIMDASISPVPRNMQTGNLSAASQRARRKEYSVLIANGLYSRGCNFESLYPDAFPSGFQTNSSAKRARINWYATHFLTRQSIWPALSTTISPFQSHPRRVYSNQRASYPFENHGNFGNNFFAFAT